MTDGKTVAEQLSQQGGPKAMKCLEQMRETGAWLTVIPDRCGGTVLSLQECTMEGLPRGSLEAVMAVGQVSQLSMGSTARREDW